MFEFVGPVKQLKGFLVGIVRLAYDLEKLVILPGFVILLINNPRHQRLDLIPDVVFRAVILFLVKLDSFGGGVLYQTCSFAHR